jgi:hypothetical protein
VKYIWIGYREIEGAGDVEESEMSRTMTWIQRTQEKKEILENYKFTEEEVNELEKAFMKLKFTNNSLITQDVIMKLFHNYKLSPKLKNYLALAFFTPQVSSKSSLPVIERCEIEIILSWPV